MSDATETLAAPVDEASTEPKASHARGPVPTASDLQRALRARYAAPEWAYFAEVRNATGFGASRTADGLAMGLWASSGLGVHGFEIKVSRSDWLRELDQPAKWEAVGQFCDHWWIVAPKRVVLPGELPKGWGLLVASPPKAVAFIDPALHAAAQAKADAAPWDLRAEVKAPRLRAADAADPLCASKAARAFLAALLRKAQEESADTASIIAAKQEGIAAGERNGQAFRATLERQVAELRKEREEWEAAAGVRFDRWQIPDLAEAYRLVRIAGRGGVRAQLEQLATRAEEIAATARRALATEDPPSAG